MTKRIEIKSAYPDYGTEDIIIHAKDGSTYLISVENVKILERLV